MKGKVNKTKSNVFKKREKLLNMEYTTGELAEVLGTTPKYIRQSLIIKRGAPARTDKSGRVWINGFEFKKWLDEDLYPKTKKETTPLADNEFYCIKCREHRITNSYVIDVNRRGTEYKKAYCPVCGTRMNKFVKAVENE